MALPVIDVEALTGDREVDALRQACEAHGFFFVTNHGIDRSLELRLENLTHELFALPPDALERLSMPRGGLAWRGWFPLGGELTSGVPDVKEGVYFGDELGEDDPRVRARLPMHGRNLFPAELPELRTVVLEWISVQRKLAHRVLQGLAASLGLPRTHFERTLTRDPLSLFRIFHYPPPRDGERERWGVGEHTDYGLLTLLKQDDCGGLEVKTPQGWVDATPLPGTFVCNLGDMLDRMTGGRYRSTPHRVRNTSGRDRYSWPYFFDPSFDARVEPLPGVLVRPVEQDAAERWDRASVHTLQGTYGEYLRAKVSRVFPNLP
jgi:isopenicillin N synthase-like dioxygenase